MRHLLELTFENQTSTPSNMRLFHVLQLLYIYIYVCVCVHARSRLQLVWGYTVERVVITLALTILMGLM